MAAPAGRSSRWPARHSPRLRQLGRNAGHAPRAAAIWVAMPGIRRGCGHLGRNAWHSPRGGRIPATTRSMPRIQAAVAAPVGPLVAREPETATDRTGLSGADAGSVSSLAALRPKNLAHDHHPGHTGSQYRALRAWWPKCGQDSANTGYWPSGSRLSRDTTEALRWRSGRGIRRGSPDRRSCLDATLSRRRSVGRPRSWGL